MRANILVAYHMIRFKNIVSAIGIDNALKGKIPTSVKEKNMYYFYMYNDLNPKHKTDDFQALM